MRGSFEWRKWWKLPKNKLALAILLVLFIGGLVQINQARKHQVEDYLESLSNGGGRFLRNERDTLSGFAGEAPDLPQAEYEELYDLYNQAYDELDDYYKNVEVGAERQGQAYYLEFIETLEQLEAKNMPIPSLLIEDTLALSKAKMTYLQAHNLVMEESLAHPTGLRTVMEVLLILTSVIGMCGFLLLFYDFFTFEYEHQQIRFIYTQPIKRHQLIWRKLLVVAGITMSLIVSALLLALFFGRVVSGVWGSLDYPVILTQVGKEIEVFTMGKLLVYGGINLILALLVTLTLLLIFSYWTKKSLVILLLSAGILFIPVVLNQATRESSWLQLTPLAPLNFSNDYLSLITRAKILSQTFQSVVIIGGCLLLFSFVARNYLERLAKAEITT